MWILCFQIVVARFVVLLFVSFVAGCVVSVVVRMFIECYFVRCFVVFVFVFCGLGLCISRAVDFLRFGGQTSNTPILVIF